MVGVILILAAILTYVKSLHDVEEGDLQIGRNYKGLEGVSNRAFRISLVLALTGTVCVGRSIVSKPKRDKDDKNPS